MNLSHLKVALITDWLCTYAGAERVLEQLLLCFPQADVFAIVDFVPSKERAFLQGKQITTSFIQKLPFAKKHFRKYLSLMPLAVESFDLSGYDLIISSSHAVAKGVIVGPDQIHISYVHSPMRYAWDMQAQYLKQTGLDKGLKGWLTRKMLHKLRMWDVISSNRVDHFISNSDYIGRRIEKVYRRAATTIYPPVSVEQLKLEVAKENYYVTASRMVPYKRMDLIIAAFKQMPDRKLVVIGDGPEWPKLQALAAGAKNITFKGFLPSSQLAAFLAKAQAFVFAAEEDFGILPVEAQACGTPVIAFGKGGACETVLALDDYGDAATGILFQEQTAVALMEAVKRFDQSQKKFLPHICRQQAEKFSCFQFQSHIGTLVNKVLAEKK